MKTKLEKQILKEVKTCTSKPKKEILDIIHNVTIMHIVREFLSVLISTSIALFLIYVIAPKYMMHNSITYTITIVLFAIVNLFALFIVCINTSCVKMLHPTDLVEKLTYNTFIDQSQSTYLYMPAYAVIIYIIIVFTLYQIYEGIIYIITNIYNSITSNVIVQTSIVSVGSICIALYIYYKHKKKQIEQLAQTNMQPSQTNLRIENWMNGEIFKEIWPFIQNDDITRIQWDGQTFLVDHKTKGRYKIPEITLSNEISETILHNLTNMINISFDEHTPCLSTKIGNLIVCAHHKTMSTNNITTFVIEKDQ